MRSPDGVLSPDMKAEFVTSDEALAAGIGLLSQSSVVAVDTEFIRRDTFYPQPGLVQLADEHHCFLVDPLTIDNFEPLRQLLVAPGIVKLVHSCSEDLEVFRRMLDVVPTPLFDTQIAAGYCGLGFGLGYQGLIARLLDVALEKGETQSDWLKRPLSDAQLGYAANDVLYLPAAYGRLCETLQETSRLSWMREDCNGLVESARITKQPDVERVKGAGALNRRQLGLLQILLDWREERAMNIDKPRTWILADKQCLVIARALDASDSVLRESAAAGRGRPDRNSRVMAELVDAANQLAEEDLPSQLPGRPDAVTSSRIKQMKARVSEMAVDWGLAPELLLRRRDIEFIARGADADSLDLPAHLNGWRREALVLPLMEAFT